MPSPLFMTKSLQIPALSFPLSMQHELSAVTVSAHQLIFSCSPLLEHVTAVILFPSDGFPVIMLSHSDLYLNYMLIFLYKEGGESGP